MVERLLDLKPLEERLILFYMVCSNCWMHPRTKRRKGALIRRPLAV